MRKEGIQPGFQVSIKSPGRCELLVSPYRILLTPDLGLQACSSASYFNDSDHLPFEHQVNDFGFAFLFTLCC